MNTIAKKTEFTAYSIHWFTLVPLQGLATKKDQIKCGEIFPGNRRPVISNHCRSKERAIEKVKSFAGKLSKQYRAYIYTDKQFGLAGKDGDIVIGRSGMKIKLTEKQKADSFII